MSLFTAIMAGPIDDGATFGNTSPGSAGTDFPASGDDVDLAGYALTQGAVTALVNLNDTVGGGTLTLADDLTCTYITDARVIIDTDLTGKTLAVGTALWSRNAYGIYVTSTGTITTISGSITTQSNSYATGISNEGTIDTISAAITNDGVNCGVYNAGTITTISGMLTQTGVGYASCIYNASGTITTISSNAYCEPNAYGDSAIIFNNSYGVIGTIGGGNSFSFEIYSGSSNRATGIDNYGTIASIVGGSWFVAYDGTTGISNKGSITEISGYLSGSNSLAVVDNTGTIGTISAEITVQGHSWAVRNCVQNNPTPTITEISGSIYAVGAYNGSMIYNDGNGATITTISGNITNTSRAYDCIQNVYYAHIGTISGNITTSNDYGNGIENRDHGTIGTISGYIYHSGSGGVYYAGIYNWANSRIDLINGTVEVIRGNSGILNNGSGAYIPEINATVINHGSGYGIYTNCPDMSNHITLIGGTITANNGGTGIYAQGGWIETISATIHHYGSGNGIYGNNAQIDLISGDVSLIGDSAGNGMYIESCTIGTISGTVDIDGNCGSPGILIGSGTIITLISSTIHVRNGMKGINNDGTIAEISATIYNYNAGAGIYNSGAITTISGILELSAGATNASSINNASTGTITTISAALSSGSGYAGNGQLIYNAGAITDITGTLEIAVSNGAYGLYNIGTVATIHTVTNRAGTYGIYNTGSGVITTILGPLVNAGGYNAIFNESGALIRQIHGVITNTTSNAIENNGSIGDISCKIVNTVAGYSVYIGSGKVDSLNANVVNLSAGNVKKDVVILGVTGTLASGGQHSNVFVG